MTDDNTKRVRIAYEAFRGGLISGLDPDVPRWEDAPNWIRDVAVVAYLQGRLDRPSDKTAIDTIALEAAKNIVALDWQSQTQLTARIQTVVVRAIRSAAMADEAKSALDENEEYDTMLATGAIPASLKHRFR